MATPEKPAVALTRVVSPTGETIFETEIKFASPAFASPAMAVAFAAHLGVLVASSARRVEVPSTPTSAGASGEFAASTDGYLYVYAGDGETHQWIRSLGAIVW
jgi:hypothetical protein